MSLSSPFGCYNFYQFLWSVSLSFKVKALVLYSIVSSSSSSTSSCYWVSIVQLFSSPPSHELKTKKKINSTVTTLTQIEEKKRKRINTSSLNSRVTRKITTMLQLLVFLCRFSCTKIYWLLLLLISSSSFFSFRHHASFTFTVTKSEKQNSAEEASINHHLC